MSEPVSLGDWYGLGRYDIIRSVKICLELIDDGFPHHAKTVLTELKTRLEIDASVDEFFQRRIEGGEDHALRQ